MKDQYCGVFAENYGHTESWGDRVIPGMLRSLPAAPQGGSILDLGCGAGHFLPYALQKDYQHYIGVDLSADMIKRARASHPAAEFLVASATEFSHLLPEQDQQFDAVVSIMMLSTLPSKQDLISVFRQSYAVLRQGGVLVVCNPHPAFDSYMQHPSGEVQTEFDGYYAEGRRYDVARIIGDTKLGFTDYHWTLEAMIGCIVSAGFRLTGIDECKSTGGILLNPSHIIFIATK
ncbi:hypothetical protein CRENPOLYSF2_1660011 [Crenothrix polyspora]|uniref:Methyltransferase domain-containing protein n=1 Tax=Crenothrix polyspora TaxID=360316 RepID=A0A1R4H2N2_9GAMM|nr:class I SAM-dependent methyltransferase [Crenothrix polyspora]SJM90436.1 hypothetical protein CRENPOLYSF2_1660011 [Crenothrix polyspora]